jgi:TRAP-type C4-dicarboxylate transport system substrate-binding protein
MPEAHRTIMTVAMEALALRTALTFEKANAAAAAKLRADGVTLWQWSEQDLQLSVMLHKPHGPSLRQHQKPKLL